MVYDRALSGNLDEWLINTIKSTWPTVSVSIESAANIQSIVEQMDINGNLQSEFEKVNSEDPTDLFGEALRFDEISKKKKTHH